jgi:peptidyl-prolyl cis-trans isomerase SurA
MKKTTLFRPLPVRGLLAALTLALPLLSPTPATAQTREIQSSGQSLDRIAAIVNDGVVLNSELDDQVAQVTARLKSQNADLPAESVIRQQVLEQLILQEIQLQRADKGGLKITDETLNNAMTEVAQRNGITLSQLPKALAAEGLDYAAYRDTIRKQLTLRLLQQRDVVQRINVTPREIDQYLERQAKHPATTSEYNVSHILIAVPQEATPAQLDAAQKRAADIIARARGGEDFAKLARAYSNSQTALDGGSLGWRKGTELPTVLADSVLALKAGEVSDPIRAPTGLHIVKLNEARSSTPKDIVDQVHARHILMRTTEVLDDATVQQKLETLRDRVLKGEDFGALAQISSQDVGTAADGGDLDWTTPDTFVPDFAQQLNSLKDGEISHAFRTQFGWHIVQMLGRRKYDDTRELERKQAADEIRASRIDDDIELWLHRLRGEAYVDIKS